MNIRHFIKDVDGWLTENEANLLYKLAKQNAFDGVIVEVGSWKGKSTICLGKGSQDGSGNKIYAIDPHIAPAEKLKDYLEKNETSTFEKFRSNIVKAQLDAIVLPIVDFSSNAVEKIHEKIDLIFIDGSHEYEDVITDFNIFFPKVREGGIMAFHDTNGGGPNKVVVNNLYRSNRFRNVRFVDSITYGVKVESTSFFNRLENYYRLVIFNLFNKYRSKPLPRFIKVIGKLIYKMVRK